MAQINNYFKKKYENDQTEFRTKIKKHRMRIAYRTIITVLILAAILVLILYKFKNMVYTDYAVLRTLEFEESTASTYIKFNNNILKYSTDGIAASNMDNQILWNQPFEMQNPMVDVCGDYVAVGDYKGTKIYVLDSTGLQGTIDTTLPLRNFCVSGTGNVAVVLEEGEVTWVKLFNKNGENIANDRTTMDKSGYPVSISISNDGTVLCVSYLVVNTGNLSTAIAYYNFGDVGQNEIDNLVSGYNYEGSLCSYVKFINQKTSFMLADNKFVIYRGDEKPESIFELPLESEVRSVFNSDKYIGIVYAEGTSDQPYRIDIYDETGNLVLSKNFDIDYNDVLFNKEYVVIYNNDECVIFNMKGDEKFRGSFGDTILEMVPTTSSTKYLLVQSSKAEEIQLK